MNTHEPFFGIAVAASAVMLLGASSVPDIPMSKSAAMIVNPGIGDYTGFRIVVEPNDQAIAIDGAGRASKELPNDLVQQFFQDLSQAAPAARASNGSCANPSAAPLTASEVNAAISIAWNGRQWSGLNCAADPRAIKLSEDAKSIERALYVQAYRARMIVVYVGNHSGYFAPSTEPYAAGYSGYYGGPFNTGGFSMPAFTTFRVSSNPYSGYPSGSMPGGSLPTSSLGGGLPAAALPLSNPASGLPSASLPGSSPYSGSPFGSSPYSGGP